jgi:predicted metalloprotease with PDZ domain
VLAFRLIILCFSLADAADTCSSPQARTFISYMVQPASIDGQAALKVDLSFRFENRSAIDLVLPSEWQGATELYKSIHQLTVLSPGSLTGGSENPSRRHLSFERGKPVRLEYLFQPERQSSSSSVSFGPVLNSDFFVLTGRNFLIYPDIPEHDSISVSLQWFNFPVGWTLADSLGVNESCQQASGLLKLSNGLFVGGDFRLQKAVLSSPQVYLAIRGKWQFDDAALAELAAKVITEEKQFWDDRNLTSYVLALVPLDGPAGEYGGTAVENGVLMFMSPGTQFSFDVQFLFAHEAFHTWNPVQLGELTPKDPVYWFTEGFTDYYARLLLLRSSLMNQQQYADEINRVYSEYMSSPARNYREQLVQAHYFNDSNAQRLPYLQGTLLALKWNATIEEHSVGHQTLDDAMRLLKRKAKVSEQVLSDQSLATFLAGFAGSGVITDIRDYIESGTTIPLPPRALGPCFQLEKKPFTSLTQGST